MKLLNLLLTFTLASCTLVRVHADDGDEGFQLKDCSEEVKAQNDCLQDNLLSCGIECVSTNSTIDGEINEETCKQETLEDCSIADCCPICFGETQAALTCQFTYENGTSYCDTECACDDVPEWTDSDDYACSWYADDPADRCVSFGNSNGKEGFVANTACCACKLLVPSGAASPTATALFAAVGGILMSTMMMMM